MKGPVTIQVVGTTVTICGDVSAGETAVITVTQEGNSTPVHEQTTGFPVTKRECISFTLPTGAFEVNIACGNTEHDYPVTVPDTPNTPTLMNPSPNNPPPEGGGGPESG